MPRMPPPTIVTRMDSEPSHHRDGCDRGMVVIEQQVKNWYRPIEVGCGTCRGESDLIEETAALLNSLRGVWDEDAVDELDHGLQSAARAIEDGADDELVLAAALHDLAHSPLCVLRSHASRRCRPQDG